jgi:hypothetical protein
MTNGLCDVKECQGLPLLGWRPLTEAVGRRVCERHWRRHRDEQDNFDLFEVFGFRRPVGLPKPVRRKTDGCACGREVLSGRRLCTVCATERERQRKKRAYHERKAAQGQPVEQEDMLRCRQCGGQRPPGRTYCQKCAERRKTLTRRQAQSRYWRKQHIHQG